MRTLKEYVGDMSRNLYGMVDSMEDAFGPMHRLGGDGRVYEIGNQFAAIYTVGQDAAIGLAWLNNEMVESIYWWDDFTPNRIPDYELVLPQGVDIETYMPQIKQAIQSKHLGNITI